jgi:hypothetical protein
MAGARLPVKGIPPVARKRLLQAIFRSFLREFGEQGSRPRRLV